MKPSKLLELPNGKVIHILYSRDEEPDTRAEYYTPGGYDLPLVTEAHIILDADTNLAKTGKLSKGTASKLIAIGFFVKNKRFGKVPF